MLYELSLKEGEPSLCLDWLDGKQQICSSPRYGQQQSSVTSGREQGFHRALVPRELRPTQLSLS